MRLRRLRQPEHELHDAADEKGAEDDGDALEVAVEQVRVPPNPLERGADLLAIRQRRPLAQIVGDRERLASLEHGGKGLEDATHVVVLDRPLGAPDDQTRHGELRRRLERNLAELDPHRPVQRMAPVARAGARTARRAQPAGASDGSGGLSVSGVRTAAASGRWITSRNLDRGPTDA